MVPRTLESFLARTGWEESSPERLERMRTALRFFLEEVDVDVLDRSCADPKFGANPWAFRIDGRVTKLCSWMQSISYDERVQDLELPAGMHLKAFRAAGEGGGVGGNWYTELREDAERLAIKPSQSTAHHFSVRKPTRSLRSTVGDVMVDWSMRPGPGGPRLGVDYWYRKGGGVQYFIWDAKGALAER